MKNIAILALLFLLFSCEKEEISGITVHKNLGMDVEFEKELIAQKIDKDGVVNDQLSVLNIDSVSSLQLDNILTQHYKGIEVFKNLDTLSIASNNLKNIDLSQNSKLSALYIIHRANNLPITMRTYEFNINNLTNLKRFHLYIYGKTKGLDLEKLSNLENLEIGDLWHIGKNTFKIKGGLIKQLQEFDFVYIRFIDTRGTTTKKILLK